MASAAIGRPHVVHCHNPTSLHYATLASLAGSARLVFTDHAQTKGVVRVGTRLEWRLVDAYASVSAETARRCGEIGYRGAPEVVHNGVDAEPPRRSRAEVRAELGLGDGVVAVNVASFFPVKAQDVLVRAMAILAARRERITTLFLGDGGERARVEALARALGLGPAHVRFLGFRTDVADIVAASELFVLPSRSEGLPMSMLEAMSHAVPVVCTAVGGNRELVADREHGYVVPPDDPEALAAAMGTLASSADLRRRLGEAAASRVRAEFSFARTADRYDTIYGRVLGADAAWSTA
jgi:glycosyltransferase involved in cell wall biosynthesis